MKSFEFMRLYTGDSLKSESATLLDIAWEPSVLEALHCGDPKALHLLVTIAVFENQPDSYPQVTD